MPPTLLGEALLFMGCCVALGFLAAWLAIRESGGKGRRAGGSNPTSAAAPSVPKAPAKRRVRKRKKNPKAKAEPSE
ncbi:hypothetical protein WJU23_16995 [Prosthecobacter sp. SYSU 5D2]|uniref:hypothetical protein n=1 Tax=Prosthecobacter sp. SYSU 5D2 TaxID=3134134 RepID=UPI0031FEEE64